MGRRAKLVRAALAAVAAAAALVVVALAALLGPVLRDPVPRFETRRGRPVAVQTTRRSLEAGRVSTDLTIRSSSGLEVDLTVVAPLRSPAPRPLVVLLAGKDTGRDAARFVPEGAAVVVAAVGYPYRGPKRPSGLGWIPAARRMQRALLDVVPAVGLALDHLVTRPDVDPERIELVGVSLGAYLAPAVAGWDPRFRRIWLVHGGGAPAAYFEHVLRERVGATTLRRGAARLLAAGCAAHWLGPERWVPALAPRPVVVIDARDEATLPDASVRALHHALGDRAEYLVTSGPHVRASRPEVVRRIRDLVLPRIAESDGGERPGDAG